MQNKTLKGISCMFTGFDDIFYISPQKEYSMVPKEKCFKRKFKNFGRLDQISKNICHTLAPLLTAENLYPMQKSTDIHIFFSSQEGSSLADKNYFSDFLEYGETAGRANKFLYTLPTSPLGEASVHFGLTGRIMYICDAQTSFHTLDTIVDNAFKFTFSNSQYALTGMAESSEKNPEVIFMLFAKITKNQKKNELINTNTSFQKLKQNILSTFKNNQQ